MRVIISVYKSLFLKQRKIILFYFWALFIQHKTHKIGDMRERE